MRVPVWRVADINRWVDDYNKFAERCYAKALFPLLILAALQLRTRPGQVDRYTVQVLRDLVRLHYEIPCSFAPQVEESMCLSARDDQRSRVVKDGFQPPVWPAVLLLSSHACVARVSLSRDLGESDGPNLVRGCVRRGVRHVRASDLVYRGKEYTLLLRRDVTFRGSDAYITLRSSKHDYFDLGEEVRIHSTKYVTSPVHWLRRAYELAPDKSPDAPAFQNPDGSPITYEQLHDFLEQVALTVGLRPCGVTSRSLRIGGATTLAALHVPIYTLKAMGRWKSVSYQLYTQLTEGATRRAFNEMGALGDSLRWPLDAVRDRLCRSGFHANHRHASSRFRAHGPLMVLRRDQDVQGTCTSHLVFHQYVRSKQIAVSRLNCSPRKNVS